jgi:TolB-like protein
MRELGATALGALREAGVGTVAGAPIDDFLARHRIRYTGGLEPASAAQARDDLGVGMVLITVVTAWARDPMPRLAVEARLVSTDDRPQILWSFGLSKLGDESPGAFDLGVVREPEVLTRSVFAALARSLADFLRAGAPRTSRCPPAGRFGPRVAYRSPSLDLEAPVTIAVLPFQNQTQRRNAGEAVSLSFVRQMGSLPNVTVIEPGVVRDDLLRFRVVLQGGISLDVARVIMELLDADLALTGIVQSYEDALSSASAPRAAFTVMLLDRKNNEVLWRSSSASAGDDGVFFFDAGRVATAGDLVCRMAQTAIRSMVERRPTAPRKLAR